MKQYSTIFRKLTILSLALFSVVVFATHQSSAQTPTTPATPGQALEIAPPVLNLTADPGESIQANISIRDVSTSPLVVTSEVNDFTANGEDGTPKLLLEEGETSPYSLKAWVAPIPSLTLKPKQIESLPVTIRVPADAAPGGYYAVVRFTATPPELEDTGVSLSASLGTLILLRVNGDAKESISVEQFTASKDGTVGSVFDAAPLDFIVRLRNEGTVHQQPTGRIAVKDMFNNHIANVNVNLAQANVLPGSVRRFEAPLDKAVIGDRWLFGRYTADLTVTYGSAKDTTTSTMTFWIIPYKLIAAIILGLLLLFFIIRIALKRYNEYIIGQTRGRRRR
jgi:hypothetical protein